MRRVFDSGLRSLRAGVASFRTLPLVRSAALATALALALLVTLSMAWPAHAVAGPNDGLPKTAVSLDRTTPRRSYLGFLEAARSGDYALAAHFLDLRAIAKSKQAADGPELAHKLGYVLERVLTVDVNALPDDPEGLATQTTTAIARGGSVEIGRVDVDEEPVPITLTRVRFDDGVSRWLVSRTSLGMVPELYSAFGPSNWEQRLPSALRRTHLWGVELWQWVALAAVLLVSVLAGLLVGSLLLRIAALAAKRTKVEWDDALVVGARGPVRLLVGVFAMWALVDDMRFVVRVNQAAESVQFNLLVLGIAWLSLRMLAVVGDWVAAPHASGESPNSRRQQLRTQVSILQRIVSVVVVTVASAVMLTQFSFVRNLGLSLLASAGVAGVVIGLAAQRSLAILIAGLQLSVTQPIRIGDLVVVEGESGIIEEITLTYVVLRVWDQRRLVVPVSHFLEHSFQNWTKVSAELLGVVMLPVELGVPVDALRDEVQRFCEGSPLWDRRVCKLQVTDATERFMTVRCLLSAKNADDVWELRCQLREHMLTYLRKLEGGRLLPRIHGVIESC